MLDVKAGCLYFVDDGFFEKANDPYLKINYDKTSKIVKIQDKKTVLLFQDMFPTRACYINEQYVRGGQAVCIADPKVVGELEKTAKKIIKMLKRGVCFTPTQPNIFAIEKLMRQDD